MSVVLRYSFEFFPPKMDEALSSLDEAERELSLLGPDFCSVTFGAGGSEGQQSSLKVTGLFASRGITVAPHISCVGMTPERLRGLLDFYQRLGIKKLLVVKGDWPGGAVPARVDFCYAHELVAAIRAMTGDYFTIIVAAYPEFHPASQNPVVDIKYFKEKVEAGADSAITQFFFNTDAYFRFVEACEKNAINIPIVPGIIPIRDYAKLVRFAAACGAEIPLWLDKNLKMYCHDPVSLRKAGVEFVTAMCQSLRNYGVDDIHFYTLNHVEPTRNIVNNLLGASMKDIMARA